MTSTKQKEKNVTSEKEWTATFPMEATKNYLSSVCFMKRLTIIALSTLTYVRDIFPESSYESCLFGDYTLKILKKTNACELSTFVSTALLASFDALEKKYLKQIALCVYRDESLPETLLECYVFTYRYNEQCVSVSFHKEDKAGPSSTAETFACTIESIQQTTRQLLRSCLVAANSVEILPLDYELSLRLYYYDEVTPPEYHPEGFVADSREDHVLSCQSSAIRVGKVVTPYHKMNLSMAHVSFMSDDNASVADQLDTSKQFVDIEEMRIWDMASAETVRISRNSPNATGVSEADIASPAATDEVGDAVVDKVADAIFRCICVKDNESNNFMDTCMVVCRECRTSQHSVCFGLLPSDVEALERHICIECAVQNPALVCSDPRLKPMLQWQRRSYSLYRRALWWCSQLQHVSVQMLLDSFLMSEKAAQRIMRKLETHDVIRPLQKGQENSLATRRTINSRKLQRDVFPCFFTTSSRSLPTSQKENRNNDTIDTYLLSPEEQMHDIERRIQENINLDGNINFGCGLERNMKIISNLNVKADATKVDPVPEIAKKNVKKVQEKKIENVKSNLAKGSKTKRKVESDANEQKAEPRPKRKCSIAPQRKRA